MIHLFLLLHQGGPNDLYTEVHHSTKKNLEMPNFEHEQLPRCQNVGVPYENLAAVDHEFKASS